MAAKRLYWILTGMALLLLLAACGQDKGRNQNQGAASHAAHLAPNGDWR